MLIKGSRVAIADNSGGIIGEIFQKYGGGRNIRVGDIVKIAIKSAKTEGKVKKGGKSKAIVIRTKYCVVSPDGHRAYAKQNAVALLTENLQPVGNRIYGFVSRKAFLGKPTNIASMSSFCEDIY